MELFIPGGEWEVIGQLALALLLGMLLGTERAAVAGKKAGTRTFALVSMGSALFALVSIHVTHSYIGIVSFDPMRIGAAVATGIGFLGAGIILFREDRLTGLTTAAGLWVAAAIGLATGFGLYLLAITGTVLTLIAFTILWHIEKRLKDISPFDDEPARVTPTE